MANVTDHPLAVAAREAFNTTVDNTPPRKGISVQLPELNVSIASEGASTAVYNAAVKDTTRQV